MKNLIKTLSAFTLAASALVYVPDIASATQIASSSEVQVSSGNLNSCAVSRAGLVICWGSNKSGQNNIPDNLGPAKQVVTSYSHTCALLQSGTVRCWGANEGGETDVPQGLNGVTQIVAGEMHTCALTENGVVSCWGDDPRGVLTRVPDDLGSVIKISAGSYHTCSISEAHLMRCWGTNWYGQNNVPSDLGQVKAISTGYAHTCGITLNGSVRCWGNNEGGESDVPDDLEVANSITSGVGHNCIVTVLASVICWGDDPLRKLTVVPTNLARVNQISAGGYHTCVVTEVGEVRCWGTNWYGQLRVPPTLAETSSLIPAVNNSCLPEGNNFELSNALEQSPSSPVISGSTVVGQILRATTGSWTSGTKICAFWIIGDRTFVSTKFASYKIVPSDFGSEVRFAVVGTLNGESVLKLSSPIVVTPDTFTNPTTPVLKGSAQVGAKVTAMKPSWEAGTTYSYQWVLDGQPIPGANTMVYIPKAKDLGLSLALKICGSKAFHTTLCLQSDAAVIQSGVLNKVGTVMFFGKHSSVGAIVTGTTSSWMPGTSLSYRWLLDGVTIPGAIGNQLTILSAYRGKVLSFQITGSMDGYLPVTKNSLGKLIP